MTCKDCGGRMIGDGFNVVLHCEEADDCLYWYTEPDAAPVCCARGDASYAVGSESKVKNQKLATGQ